MSKYGVKWLLTTRQYAAANRAVKSTLEWMHKYSKGKDYNLEVKFTYDTMFDKWFLHINGRGCGSTYSIKKGDKHWKHR